MTPPRTLQPLHQRHRGILRGLLQMHARHKGFEVSVIGIDAQDDPVLQHDDANGLSEPWAARKSDDAQKLYPSPTGEVIPVEQFEQVDMSGEDMDLLWQVNNIRRP